MAYGLGAGKRDIEIGNLLGMRDDEISGTLSGAYDLGHYDQHPNHPRNKNKAAAGGSANYNTGGTTGMAGNKYTDPRSRLSDEETRDAAFGARSGESFGQYAPRLYEQGAKRFAPRLNPNSFENPQANLPFARWAQNRYQYSLPTTAMIRSLTDPNFMQGFDSPESRMEDFMKDSFQGGLNKGGWDYDQGQNILGGMEEQLKKVMAGDFSGLDDAGRENWQGALEDPNAQGGMYYELIRNGLSPFFQNSSFGRIQDAIQGYHGDPGNYDDKPFLSYLRRK